MKYNARQKKKPEKKQTKKKIRFMIHKISFHFSFHSYSTFHTYSVSFFSKFKKTCICYKFAFQIYAIEDISLLVSILVIHIELSPFEISSRQLHLKRSYGVSIKHLGDKIFSLLRTKIKTRFLTTQDRQFFVVIFGCMSLRSYR